MKNLSLGEREILKISRKWESIDFIVNIYPVTKKEIYAALKEKHIEGEKNSGFWSINMESFINFFSLSKSKIGRVL